MNSIRQIRVLMVCMGNICRSPTAEGVFRKRVRDLGMEHAVIVDSAGTHAYHVGSAPDPRARKAASERGYDLGGLVGRQVALEDFEEYDLILAMDEENLQNLRHACPMDQVHKLRLFMAYSPRFRNQEVPDPYYGGPRGFEHVLDMVEDAADGLLAEIRSLQA